MWTLAASVAAFSITLKQVVFFAVVGSAFVVHFICYAIISKRSKRKAADAQSSSAERPSKSVGQNNSSF